ncbi:hypothetical protein LOTGIDRAFT_113264 [Lottia gigantea]|uniref:CHCH domain-containing protein n=1 Tax=Lottia gigantea TaxID=225164 RepID=V4AQN7_LOTGI|nr:hypothetical protein LOTGIDRAFT_113264 [Lottia gigantea]ESO99557.1 hypothetical protein LOTGIDRAFT_113264 [Lottia gigantea]
MLDLSCAIFFSGPVLDNGEINFHCTCAGTMFSGPCNIEIREFLTCSNKDKSPEKCMEQFEAMFNCELDYPEIYDIKDKLEGVDDKASKTVKELDPETKES